MRQNYCGGGGMKKSKVVECRRVGWWSVEE